MKQRITKVVFIFGLLLSGLINALGQGAALPFTENFDAAVVPPTDWVSFRGTNGLGTAQDWKSQSSAAFVENENVSGGLAEDWLVTPLIRLKAGYNVLTFDEQRTRRDSRNSSYAIKVSTSSQSTHTDFTDLITYIEEDIPEDVYTQRIIDLSAYSGSDVYIAFVMTNDRGNNWYIDNVSVDGSDVLEASNFTVTSAEASQIDLDWDLNANSNNVLLAVSADAVFGDPVNGNTYNVSDAIPGGGTVIYSGSSTSYAHTSLDQGTDYYYKLWSLDATPEYSYFGVETSGTTTGTSTVEYTDFESGTNGWLLGANGWGNNKWARGTASAYRGSYSAYHTMDNGATASYDSWQSGTITMSKTGIAIPAALKSVELSFFYKAVGAPGDAYGEVYVNGSLVSASQEYQMQTNWTNAVIDLSAYSGQTISIQFRWIINWAVNSANPGFCVDDIRIDGSSIARVQDITAGVVGIDDIQLNWTKNTADDDIIIAYSADPTIGDPVGGNSYNVGDFLSGGGQIIYSGSAASYLHNDVTSAVAYYKAWSKDVSNAYSTGLSTSSALPVTLPFTDDFEGNVDAQFRFKSGLLLVHWTS